jgi:intein/homing endonuclease
LFGFSGGAAFQEGEYIGSTINFGNKNLYSSLNNNFNYTCFPKGTKISLSDGKIKNIEEIKIGDKVLSFNESTKEIEEKRVEKVFIREAKKILEIKLLNVKVIRPIPDHEFYLNGKWVEAKDLKVSDELLNINLEKVGIISIEERLGDRVYNFTVQDNHNYFAENVLVHNTDYDGKTSSFRVAGLFCDK